MSSKSQRGDQSHRSNVSEASWKTRCQELESRLRQSQENSKSIAQTLQETQDELESLVKEHELLSNDFES